MIAIVDYGVGNVKAIANMIKRAGGSCIITSETKEILGADKLILPGVGAFDTAVQSLEDRGLIQPIEQVALHQKKPVLGICLGMQLLTEGSEEGKKKGFGWIRGYARRFDQANGLKVPHMKWNGVVLKQKSELTRDLAADARFYFVHSYYVTPERQDHVLLETEYGVPFASAIYKENIYGVQFHPEKSHRYGLQLLSAFVKL